MYVGHQPHYAPVAESVIPRTSQRKPGVLKQFAIFLQRNVWSKKSNLQYILITLLQAPVLAAVCALLTHYSPQEGYSVMDNKNLVSYLFMAVIVAVFLGMSGSAEEIIKDRLLLKREKFLDLSYKSYISSKIIYMAGIAMLQTLLFVVVGNSIMGVTDLLHVWWGILFLVAFLSSLIGLLLSQCLNSVVAIYTPHPSDIALWPRRELLRPHAAQHYGQCPRHRRCHPLPLGIRGTCRDAVQGQCLRSTSV